MKNLILILLLCITLIDAWSFPKIKWPYFGKRKNIVPNKQEGKSDDKIIDKDNEYKINHEWFNFTLVFFPSYDKFLKINERDEFSKISPYYRPQYRSIFLIHGWQNEFGDEIWLNDYRDMLFRVHNAKLNLFIVDWGEMAKDKYYYRSAAFTKIVGVQLGSFIKYLKYNHKINMDNVHIIGHSLGAHIAGFSGKAFQNFTDNKFIVGRITGLDPAGPSFILNDSDKRLDRTDARLVEILHTNIGSSPVYGLGNPMKLGHFDLFLNGGGRQKGCYSLLPNHDHDVYYPKFYQNIKKYNTSEEIRMKNEKDKLAEENLNQLNPSWSSTLFCHHGRACDFYLEERLRNSTCQRLAYSCKSYKKFKAGLCRTCGRDNSRCRLFEYNPLGTIDVPLIKNRSYFLDTNGKSPFCAHHYSLELEIEKSNFKKGTIDLTVYGEKNKEKFQLDGEWNSDKFTMLVTTDKDLGRLVKASATVRKSWFDRYQKRKIEFLSLTMYYMSNTSPKIRNDLSTYMFGYVSRNNRHLFLTEL